MQPDLAVPRPGAADDGGAVAGFPGWRVTGAGLPGRDAEDKPTRGLSIGEQTASRVLALKLPFLLSACWMPWYAASTTGAWAISA